ncbi:MAG: sulfurtransferase [Chloroflexota bacterium]
MTTHLIETNWLQEHLNDASLRVFDCTVFLNPGPNGYEVESGRTSWEEAHIPGSGFLDLVKELSDPESKLGFTMPSTEQFSAAMSRHGVNGSTQVILYDQTNTIWATRVWWMLRAFGFDRAAILDGGWQKWQQEARPISTAPSDYPPGNFVATPRPELIASKEDVLAAMNAGSTCLLNTLNTKSYQAKRIPGSKNLYYGDLLDPETHAYLPLETLRERFAQIGTKVDDRIITYCGGGIGASSNAFILTLLGAENVAVYDGSMSEWTADESLPVEAG